VWKEGSRRGLFAPRFGNIPGYPATLLCDLICCPLVSGIPRWWITGEALVLPWALVHFR